jgi:nitronate monooxygenase
MGSSREPMAVPTSGRGAGRPGPLSEGLTERMSIARLLETRLPVLAAPMAGGPSSVALGAAVSSAGGFAFLAGGYKRPDALAAEIAAAREWDAPFGVNLFAPGSFEPDREAFAAYAQRLTPEAEVYQLELDPTPHTDDDHWHDKLALLLDNLVPVVSFTFGIPPAGDIARLRKVGSIVLASVTTVDEALAAEAAGVDGLVVQGSSAGGHSATWDPQRPIVNRPTEQLVTDVHAATRLPLIAAGGIDGPHSAAALIAAGAEAVAVGTLFLRAEEAGTVQTHRDALAARGGAGTVMTCAFTGRPARALRNGFVERHASAAIIGYPAVHHLTRELRRRAAAAGDADRLHLWAGTGYRQAEARPASMIIEALSQQL